MALLFDHLVGARRQAGWHLQAEGLRGLEIDDQLELGRLLNRQITRLLAFENARGVDPDYAQRVREV